MPCTLTGGNTWSWHGGGSRCSRACASCLYLFAWVYQLATASTMPKPRMLTGLCHSAMQLEEVRLKSEDDSCCSVDCVTELRSLRHLDRVIDSDASSIVVVAFYSRVRPFSSAGCFQASSNARAQRLRRPSPTKMCCLHSCLVSMHAVPDPTSCTAANTGAFLPF
jgi:hypothetical protein